MQKFHSEHFMKIHGKYETMRCDRNIMMKIIVIIISSIFALHFGCTNGSSHCTWLRFNIPHLYIYMAIHSFTLHHHQHHIQNKPNCCQVETFMKVMTIQFKRAMEKLIGNPKAFPACVPCCRVLFFLCVQACMQSN